MTFEATGGYELMLRNALKEHGHPYHMANPNKVRAFAKMKGLLAKTDRLDAELISHYAEMMRSKESLIKTENEEGIRVLLKRRGQIIDDKKREQCRLDKFHDPKKRII